MDDRVARLRLLLDLRRCHHKHSGLVVGRPGPAQPGRLGTTAIHRASSPRLTELRDTALSALFASRNEPHFDGRSGEEVVIGKGGSPRPNPDDGWSGLVCPW